MIWLGKVSRLQAGYAFVTVPDLSRSREYGPLEPLAGVTLAVGDRVLVAQLGNQPDTLVLLRRLS